MPPSYITTFSILFDVSTVMLFFFHLPIYMFLVGKHIRLHSRGRSTDGVMAIIVMNGDVIANVDIICCI